MASHTGRTVIGDYLTKQQMVMLPPSFAAGFPASHEAEVDLVPGSDSLTVTVVSRDKRSMIRRYRISRHQGSARLSVPRFWLTDKKAKAGDVLEVEVTGSHTCLIHLRRQ